MKKRLYYLLALPFLTLLLFNSTTNAQDITPVKDGDLYSFQVENMYFEVDASFGAHFSSLMLGENEVMFVDRDYHEYLWGSTLWPSPQSQWGWPPAEELDSDPYTGGILGNLVILKSEADSEFKISFTKIISASSADTSVTILYEMNNEGSSSTTKAAWEVTRVPGGGITFWPMGEGSVTGELSEYTEIIDDVAWYGFQDSDVGSRKFFSDGADGWFAHVNDDNILFVKQFADVAKGDEAPEEGEIELWLTGDHAYIELENQGVYTVIPADYKSTYEVKWYLRALPADIAAEVGNQALVDYVNSILGDPIEHRDVEPIEVIDNISTITNGTDLMVINGNLFLSELPASEYKLNIFDLSGKLIHSTEFQAENQHNISLGNFVSGLYIYQLSGTNYLSTGKLVIR